jgi:hypothetical protein
MTHGPRGAGLPEEPGQAGSGRSGGAAHQGYLRSGRRARIGLAVVLLLYTFAGASAMTASPSRLSRGPLRQHAGLLALAVEVVLAALLTANLLRRRRAAGQGHLAGTLNSLLRPVLITGLIAIPLIGLLTKARPLRPRPRPGSSPRPQPSPAPTHSHPPAPASGHALPFNPLWVLVALLAAVALWFLIATLRRRPRYGRFEPVPEDQDDDDSEQLRQAVRSGQRALAAVSEARAAIIACYVAMEASLASAGAVRDAAETPDELLARVTADGLVSGDAAATLTALFYEARFSAHDMPQRSRAAAQQALAELAVAAAPASTAAAGAPGAGPGPADGRAGR